MLNTITLSELVLIVVLILLITTLINLVINRVRSQNVREPHKKSLQKQETQLLNSILCDIKRNTHEWISVAYSFAEEKDESFINDKKNIAVIVEQQPNTIMIKLNLRHAHRYREHDPDNVVTTISGEHVAHFLAKVEREINKRGKELAFMQGLLNQKHEIEHTNKM